MKHCATILIFILLLSCNRNSREGTVKTMADRFPVDIAAKDSVVEFPNMFALEEWGIKGDTLFILSSGQDSIVSLISMENMSLVQSFGSIGQGPDELLHPHLLKSEQGGMFLGDGMSGRIRRIDKGCLGEIISNPGRPIPMNDACLLGRSHLAYVFYSPRKTQLLIQELSSGSVSDSLSLPMLEPYPKTEVSTLAFKVSSNGQFFVAAYQGVDRFDIVRQSDHHFMDPNVYKGSSPTGENRFFFIDVNCGSDFFAVLSMKGKDVFSEKSFPDIEIYAYDGSPLARLRIDFLASKVLIDDEENRLLLLSANDENLHLIPIPEQMIRHE